MPPDSTIDISFAVTLDDLCRQVHQAAEDGRRVESVHVPPEIYDSIATAKAKQHLARGNPLLLLALDLVRDEDVPSGSASVR
jgi:hypothetical protein